MPLSQCRQSFDVSFSRCVSSSAGGVLGLLTRVQACALGENSLPLMRRGKKKGRAGPISFWQHTCQSLCLVASPMYMTALGSRWQKSEVPEGRRCKDEMGRTVSVACAVQQRAAFVIVIVCFGCFGARTPCAPPHVQLGVGNLVSTWNEDRHSVK